MNGYEERTGGACALGGGRKDVAPRGGNRIQVTSGIARREYLNTTKGRATPTACPRIGGACAASASANEVPVPTSTPPPTPTPISPPPVPPPHGTHAGVPAPCLPAACSVHAAARTPATDTGQDRTGQDSAPHLCIGLGAPGSTLSDAGYESPAYVSVRASVQCGHIGVRAGYK